MLIEILGAQKQRISRLGVELKHVNGAGNKNKKGETESSFNYTNLFRDYIKIKITTFKLVFTLADFIFR